ncbi:MAG: hypothetical protein EAZ91_25305 [Cytophagales bacterium]|nr:MAG: hypothetical protein EAZ91_25305 [Cytophagales bacterium]
MHQLSYCISLWLLSYSAVLARPTFHTILIAATNDHSVGIACQIDLLATHAKFGNIAEKIGYQYNPIVIKDREFGFEAFAQAMRAVRSGPDDIIVFYYTGHGFNVTRNESDFPLLQLDTINPKKIPPLDLIHNLLLEKKPRFCLTIGDCCNRLIDQKLPVERSMAKGTVCDSNIFRQLFLNQRGGVLVASSKRGQVSGASLNGSHFTWALLQSLDYACYYNEQISWKQVLDDTQTRMQNIAVARVAGQQAIYAITEPGQSPAATGQQAAQTDTMPAPPTGGGIELIADTTVTQLGPAVVPAPRPITGPTASGSQPAGATVQPNPLPGTTRPDYSQVNQFLNGLVDESKAYSVRKGLQRQAGDFFVHNARVKIFVNDIQVETVPLSDLMERYGLLAEKIRQINIIETFSKLDPSGRFYTEVAVQEIWN